MKKIKVAIISLASIACFSGFSFIALAQPDSLDDKQLEQIRANCLSVNDTLNRLRTSDALLRVNRGQVYESIQTKLMDRFNVRLINNKIDNKDLVAIREQYNINLNQFRANYISYEEQLVKAMSIDCQSQPQRYYQTVLLVRGKRQLVHQEIVKLNQQIDQYSLAVGNLKQQLLGKGLEE